MYESNHFKSNKDELLAELANDPDETEEELMDILIQEYLDYFSASR